MHALGSPEGVTLLDFKPEHQEEQQAAQEKEVQLKESTWKIFLSVLITNLPHFLKASPGAF